MSRWSETEVKCWIPKSSELEVGQITHFHNVDCHAYEARIAELTAELARVKAESLRVVADGDACRIGELKEGQYFGHDGDTGYIYVDMESGCYTSIHQGQVDNDLIVQPVRLERWE